MLVSPVIVIGTPRSGTTVVTKWLMDHYGVIMELDGFTTINERKGLMDTREDKIVVQLNTGLNIGEITKKHYKYHMRRYFKEMKKKANGQPWGFKDPRLTHGLDWVIKHFRGNLTIIRTKRRADLVMRSMIHKAGFTPEKAANTINGYNNFFKRVLQYPGMPVIEVLFDGSRKMPDNFVKSFNQSLIDRKRLLER
ncbi:MAG TPA: sulfotransferase [Anaerolineales bacterium]|nr:sulfotransferase [Anaerolineales bacterium]